MDKIKVLHLITHLGFGGATDNTLLTVKDLPRTQYEVHLAAGQDYMDWVAKGREYADAFFLFPELYRDPHPLADVRVVQQLTKFMKEQKYDIVHTHNAKAGIAGRIAAQRAGVPIILHTYHLLSWLDAHAVKPTPVHKAAAALKRQIYFQLERYAGSLSDALVTVCESNTEEAIRSKVAPAAKFSTIYSGIDFQRLDVMVDRAEKCHSLGLNPTQPIVGMIGRLSPQKAPLDFVAAAKVVLQQRPQTQFILVGDGPLTEEVKQAVGDETRIKALGYRDDVPEIYGVLNVFALASLWEGLGRALTEAMIAGVPVTATAVNGIPELVIHGKTGLLSPPEAPTALAENMVWLLDHPVEAKQMSLRAQALVLPQFGAKLMVDKIDALYIRLLQAKKSHQRLLYLAHSTVKG